MAGSSRIDNRAELAAALDLGDSSPSSDLVLVAEAFDRWGEDCFDRLRGDFGLVVFDLRRRRLVLASDAFGTKPLYHYRGGGWVAFAANAAVLLGIEGVPRALCENGIADQIAGSMSDHAVTVYENVLRVPRAAYVVHEAAGARTAVYWRPGRAPMLRLAGDADYVAAGRAVLDQIVAGHLATGEPIGVMLSGGLDSTAIAATLAKFAPGRIIRGYTTIPSDDFTPDPLDPLSGSERPNVERLQSRHPNLRVTFVADKVSPVAEAWREAFRVTGMPVAGATLMARRLALMRAAAADGVRVLLTGDGGNLTFSWEGNDNLAALARSGRWISLYRDLTGLARTTGESRAALFRRWVIREMLPPRILAAYHRARENRAVALPAGHFLSKDFSEEKGLERRAAAGEMNPRRRQLMTDAAIRVHMLEFLQPQWASTYALLAAQMGLTLAAPLRDRRMVDFCLSAPPDQYFRNGVTRWLARRMLEDRVPAENLRAPWGGHNFPDAMQYLERWRPEFLDRLSALETSPLASRMIDLPRLRAMLEAEFPKTLRACGARQMEFLRGLPDALLIGGFLRWHEGGNR